MDSSRHSQPANILLTPLLDIQETTDNLRRVLNFNLRLKIITANETYLTYIGGFPLLSELSLLPRALGAMLVLTINSISVLETKNRIIFLYFCLRVKLFTKKINIQFEIKIFLTSIYVQAMTDQND